MFNLASHIFVLYKESQPQKYSLNVTFRTFPQKLEKKTFFFSNILSFFQLHKQYGSVSHMACQPYNLLTLCILITLIRVSHKTSFLLQ